MHGVDYFFVSKAQFEQWLASGTLLEHAVVYGDYKGIPRQQVSARLTLLGLCNVKTCSKVSAAALAGHFVLKCVSSMLRWRMRWQRMQTWCCG